MNGSGRVIRMTARAVELALGCVFLAGAVLKAGDINLFTVQISYYGVLANPDYVTVAALATLFLEMTLGGALLLGLRLRGAVFAAVMALLAVFTALIAYGWAFHDLKDCGCFGPIELSPRVSIAKNVLLAAFCGYAWWGLSRAAASGLRAGFVAVRALVILACAAGTVAYAHRHLEPVQSKSDRAFAQFVFDVDGIHYDLGQDEYLVAMLSMTCEHCMECVPAINALAETPGFPTVVALCYEEDSEDLEDFRAATDPIFPLLPLGDRVRTFFSLIGGAPPRFIYVRDGKQVQYWDDEVPEADAVVQARAAYDAGVPS